MRQIIPWHGSNIWAGKPCEERWHAPTEAYKLDLNVHSAVLREISRVKIEPPQITMVATDREFFLTAPVRSSATTAAVLTHASSVTKGATSVAAGVSAIA